MAVSAPPDRGRRHAARIVVVTLAIGVAAYFLVAQLGAEAGAVPVLAAISLGGIAFMSQILLEVAARVNDLRAVAAQMDAPDARQRPPGYQSAAPSASHVFDDVLADLASKATRIDTRAPALLIALGREELRATSKLLDEFGRQDDVSYEGEDRDWLLRLTRHATGSIQATSKTTVDAGGRGFGDGGLWLSELGQRYIQAQADAVARGVTIQRVFIMDRPELLNDAGFEKVWTLQKAHGIDVRVIDPSVLPGEPDDVPADFILFDREISYETIPDDPLPTGHPIIKETSLISEPHRVMQRAEYFDQLWAAAAERPG